ncbi:MAG: hypothetical protein JWN36_2657 [Microbacteriaceae bacterium]|nr:hypothetical protein [Microbacteriaceae bacterium]
MSTAVIGIGASHRVVRPSAAQPTPRLRMTRRGRIVLTALVAIPLAAGGFVGVVNAGGAAANSSASSATFHYVTVAQGESLWQIATKVAPSADPRDVISDIVDLNQLSTTELQAGQRIAIPLQYEH